VLITKTDAVRWFKWYENESTFQIAYGLNLKRGPVDGQVCNKHISGKHMVTTVHLARLR